MKRLVIGGVMMLTVLGAASAAWTASAARFAAPAPATVAVVDLVRVVNGLNEKGVRESELQARAAELQKSIAELEKRAKDEQAGVQVLPAGSAERRAAQDRLRRLAMQYEVETTLARRLMDELEGEIMRDLFNKINAAAADLAKRSGFTMVFSSDGAMELPTGSSADAVRGIISQRRVLYLDPSHDITDELITAMNNAFAVNASGARPAAPAPAQPAGRR